METLLADLQARTVKGLLLPYGEKSRPSNVGAIMFSRGIVAVPTDPAVVTLNRSHRREDPVGRATQLEDTAAGIVATFAIADTPEGDSALLDIAAGKMKRLSAEVKNITRDGIRALTGALFGAALVDEGAFASATLYAELLDTEATSHSEETYVDENGVTWKRVWDSETTTQETENGVTTTTVSTVTEETSEASAEEEATKEETMEAILAPNQPATVPATLLAGAANPTPESGQATVVQVAHALAAYFGRQDASGIQALAAADRSAGELMFAALNDIKMTTNGSVGVALKQPQWIGDVWQARTRARRITPLIGNAPLTSLKIKGFKFGTKPAGGDWDGDKANVPTNTPTTTAVDVTALRWAGGHDIAREYVDFDTPEFWLSYFAYMTNDYVKWGDTKCLAALIDGATDVVAGDIPSGANPATVLLVDGALSIIATEEATPSFAVVAANVYRQLLLQNKDDLIATLTLGMGLESGDLAGFRILPSSGVAAGTALMGSRDAATFYELPGAPIRTEALDLVKGGVDKAFFGYAGTVINNPSALVLVAHAEEEE